jgi:hypothetical protein
MDDISREEVAKLAREYRNFADKMTTDAYQRRWRIISAALDHFSKHCVDTSPGS